MAFFDKPVFDPRFKFWLHIIQIVIAVAAIGLSVPRLFMKGQPRTRANTIALGMGAKSLIILGYQLLTEHVQSCRRWASLKANLILNSLEVVFWGAVAFLIIQAQISVCIKVGCILGWIVVVLAIIMNILALYASIISFREFRRSRYPRNLAQVVSTSDEENFDPKESSIRQSHGHVRYAR